MAKKLFQENHKKKAKKKRRLSRKIRIIKKNKDNKNKFICNNDKSKNNNTVFSDLFNSIEPLSQSKYVFSLSLINHIHLFLKENIIFKNNVELQKNLIDIIRVLSMKENEFFIMIILIENYIQNNEYEKEFNIEKETLYNIGIMAKKRLNEDISNEYINMEISVKELITKNNYYNSFCKKKLQNYYCDYGKMIEYICNINKKLQTTEEEKERDNNSEINRNDLLNKNKLTNQNEYDFFKDTIHGISHDNDQLPSYEDFCLKPDDCDINNQNLRKMFKDYLH